MHKFSFFRLKIKPAGKSRKEGFMQYYTTRSPCLQRLSSDKGKWVTYQLRLRGITHTELAKRIGCSRPTVSNVLGGRTSSSKVYITLCDILGFDTIGELLASPRRSAA